MSAFSVHEPFPQFHGRDGQPLDGGFVWIGTAGLDAQANPIPVFFDPALTIPASQPIGTRSGFAANGATPTPVYCNADDYSIKVLDANGALVIAYPNAVDRFPAAVITGNLSSANVSYTRGLAGTPTRTVEGRLRDFTSVFDFMMPAEIAAVQASTFLVNVTAAVRNAINSTAREVYFPPGGYLVGDFSGDPALWIDSISVGKTLRGAGRQATVIKNVGLGAAIGSTGNPITNNTSIHICDMSIEGQAGTGPGILFDYTSQSVIERVDCYNHGSSGIRILNGAHVSVVDAWCRSNTGVGLDISSDAFFVDVRGGTFESSASGAFVVKGGGGLSPRFVTFTGSSFRANTNSNVDVGEARDVRFFGCSFDVSGATTTRHLSVDGGAGLASGVVLDGCSLVGVNGALTTVGVYAAACEDLSVMNCVVDCTGATAYDVAASAVRTRFYDNAVILGTQTNASTSTFTRTTLTGSSSLGFGGGEGLVNFDALANAMKMRRVPVSNLPAAGTTQLGVLQLRALDSAGLLSSEYRVWSRGGNLVGSLTDPANITDGITIGPGVQTYTVATLPAAAPVGTMAKVTDGRNLPAQTWGDVIAGGGTTSRFVIHTGGGVWTIIGNA
jgi:hypothetical protein